MMLRKVETLLWFLQRPKLYPYMIGHASNRLFHGHPVHEDTQEKALKWCAEIAVDINTALEKLTGKPLPKPVRDVYPENFKNAERIAEECPVKMGGPGDLDLLYWSAEHLKASMVVETGVAYGWSSLAILLSLKNRAGAKLISTDMPYFNKNNDPYVGCVVPDELRTNWTIFNYADRQALPRSLRIMKSIDMCHYDSDKTYEGRIWAYPVLWRALRPGGFFISDDIQNNTAFRKFSDRVACEPTVIKMDKQFVGVLVKPINE